MTKTEYAAIITTPAQAEIMWRALWAELEQIEKGYSTRRSGANEAYTAHLETLALLRQINLRFRIINRTGFDEMVKEASLPEPMFAA